MNATEFKEKTRILYEISKVFDKQMNRKKLKQLVDLVFETSGVFIGKYEYCISERICGDVTGLRQGTSQYITMKLVFMLTDYNTIVYRTICQKEEYYND